MERGIGSFGKGYEVMYRNDTHAEGSVDRVFYETMIKLDADSADCLYAEHVALEYNYRKGARPRLEAIVDELSPATPADAVERITGHCRELVERCNVSAEEMVFGGTEEEILERGTYWCTDIARAACVLLQVAGVPSRILITANTRFSYCGHSVVEAFYCDQWGVVDPTNGVIIRRDDGTPASARDIQINPAIANRAFFDMHPDWQDSFPPGDQYESVGIVDYDIAHRARYDYTTSRINAYYSDILKCADQGWPGGLQWIHGEV